MKIRSLWLFGLIMIMVLIYAGCAPAPEKSLLDKYFHALSMNDNQTMAAMALEPLAIDYVSYRIESIGQEQVEPAPLPELAKKEAEAKKRMDDNVGPVVEAKDALDAAKDDLDNARTAAARATLKKKVEQLQATYDEKYNAYKELQRQYNEAKEATAKEEEMTLFSLGLKSLPGVREMTGNVHIKDVVISVKTKAGAEKKYRVIMKKYTLKDEASGRAFNGQWKILRFVPVS